MSGNEPARVLCERQPLSAGTVALLRPNRPGGMNPLDWQTVREPEQQLLEADADREVRPGRADHGAGRRRCAAAGPHRDLRGRQAGASAFLLA